jgi:hypothetical protein
MSLHINAKFTPVKLKSTYFPSFVLNLHSLYFSRCRSMYKEYLTVSGYPLSQGQWDRCNQQNHQTYIVKGHHLNSRGEIQRSDELLFVLLGNPRYEVCLIRIQVEVDENRNTVGTHRNDDFLLNKYIHHA